MMLAIHVEELTKTYRSGVQALRGMTFSVRAGEIFGLLGPNGAGKSTTVRILATLSQPGGGQAFVAGCDVFTEPGRVRRRIGYVAQASGVDQSSTGRENLTLQGQLQRVPPRELRGRVDEMLKLVRLTEVADRLVSTYSGGMKRRLDLAMGLIRQPAVLFLDEPTTGFDPETRASLWQDLLRMRQESNLAVLLMTHHMEEADFLCDRLAIVNGGRVVTEGTADELRVDLGGDIITLELDGRAEQAVNVARSLPSVLEATASGQSLVARAVEGESTIAALIAALGEVGTDVRGAKLTRPSLAEVYLHHTGTRSLAADEAREGEMVETRDLESVH